MPIQINNAHKKPTNLVPPNNSILQYDNKKNEFNNAYKSEKSKIPYQKNQYVNNRFLIQKSKKINSGSL